MNRNEALRHVADRSRALLDLLHVRRWVTGYHGLWSLGVGLLRNLGMARKTALVAAVVTVPFSVLLVDFAGFWSQRHAEHQRAEVAHAQYQAIAEAHANMLELSRLLFLREHGKPHDTLPAVRERQVRLQAVVHGELERGTELQSLVEAAASGARKRLAASFDLMLARMDDNTPAAVPGTPAPRWLAVQGYLKDLETMRSVLDPEWSAVIDVDPDNKLLDEGLASPQFQIMTNMSRMAGMGARLYTEPLQESRLRDIHALVARTELLVEQAAAKVEAAADRRLVDRSEVSKRLDAMAAQLRLVSRLATLRRTVAEPGEVAALSGVPLPVFVKRAQEAVDHGAALQVMAFQAIGKRLKADRAHHQQVLMWRVVGLGFTGLLALYLSVCLYKVMAGGLQTLCQQLDRLGRGDLTIRPRGWGNDEIGQALRTLGESTQRMAQLFEAVTQGVAAVSHASREVAVGNAGLSTRTDEIQRSIDTVAQCAGTFSDTMDRCVRDVEQAAEHVRAMRIDAQRSRKAMAGLRERMRVLQTKSREITRVVGLVESVAFQTKLLSLNASVEAARAGEAGKGFAVVAQEVRGLAQRSADAANKINAIVTSSVAEIEEGNLMTDRASKAVQHTDDAIQAVDQIMNDIVRMSRDSMSQSQEVLDIARQVEQSVGGNAQVVGQLTQASSALRDQGDSLKRSVHHFVLH